MKVKTFYYDLNERIISFLLVITLAVSVSLSPAVTVYADSEPQWIDGLKSGYSVPQAVHEYLLSLICGVYPGNPVEFYNKKKEEYDSWWSDIYEREKNKHGGGSTSFDVEVTADDMTKFKEITDSNLTALNGYYLITPSITKNDAISLVASSFLSDNDFKNFLSYLKSYCPAGFFLSVTSDRVFLYTLYSDTTQVAYISGSYATYMIPDSKIDSSDGNCKSYGGFYEKNRYAYSTGSSLLPVDLYNYAYGGSSPLKLFYSYKDFVKWRTGGKSNVYISTKYVNYQPETITINPTQVSQIVNNNTVQKVYNESVTNITESGGESGLSQDQVQEIVDKAVEKVLSAMATPTPTPAPTSTPGGGTSGGGTSGGSSADLSETNGLISSVVSAVESFEKKFDSFAVTFSEYINSNGEKLDQIISILESILEKDSSSGGAYDYSELSNFLTTLWNESDKKFDSMIDLLEKNNAYQKKLLDSLNDIKAILAVDSVMDFFKDRSSETANKAKEKFPTSIPWDIGIVVNAFAAEPQAPVMEIPLVYPAFNIDEKITIDLSNEEWEKLAKLCRYLLSLLFVLYMVHLTRKLFFSDGDD